MFWTRLVLCSIFAFGAYGYNHGLLAYKLSSKLAALCQNYENSKVCQRAGIRCVTGLQDDKEELISKYSELFDTCITVNKMETLWKQYKTEISNAYRPDFFSTLDANDAKKLRCCMGQFSGKFDNNNRLNLTAVIDTVTERIGTKDPTALNGFIDGINNCPIPGDDCDMTLFKACTIKSCIDACIVEGN